MSEILILSDKDELNKNKTNDSSFNLKGIHATKNSIIDLNASSKKHLFQETSVIAESEFGLPSKVCFKTLSDREKLGNTGLGNGIAIPHGIFDGIKNSYAIFLRLHKPINFDSVDGIPVDLVFTLLAPRNNNSAHLKDLSKISRYLNIEETRKKLRGAGNADALLAILVKK